MDLETVKQNIKSDENSIFKSVNSFDTTSFQY